MNERYFMGMSCEDGEMCFFASRDEIDLTDTDTALYGRTLLFLPALDPEYAEEVKDEEWFSEELLTDHWEYDHFGDWVHCLVSWREVDCPITEIDGEEAGLPPTKDSDWKKAFPPL